MGDYLFSDHLGSTSVSYNTSTGAVSAQRYTPYGAPRGPASTLPTDYRFTGQRSEQAGLGSLYDYNARFYSPALGRFLQADTIVPSPGNPQSLNRYAYVLNNPLRYTDPTGHWVESAFDVISLGLTINDIRNEGFTLGNTVALITDAASVALPIVPAGVSHALRAWKLANKAVNAADAAADAVKLVNSADVAPDVVQTFIRTIDRAPINPKNYELKIGDVSDGGLGLSTISNPPVSPKTVLEETGRSRSVQIPRTDVPEGMQWKKTPGNYGKPILDNNHWELWNPAKHNNLSPNDYVDWWNQSVAPDLARRAANWVVAK